LLGLDTFGCRAEQKQMRHGQDGAAYDPRVFARIEIRDERTVDPEHVERELPQKPKARTAGAVVVDRQPHAHVPQREQALSRALGIVQQGTLRELELNELRVYGMRLQHAAHCIGEVRLPQLSCGDAYRYPRHRHTFFFPATELLAYLLDHPKTQRDDLSALLGHRDELGRAQASPLRMIPKQLR